MTFHLTASEKLLHSKGQKKSVSIKTQTHAEGIVLKS